MLNTVEQRLSVKTYEWLMTNLKRRIKKIFPEYLITPRQNFIWPWFWDERSNIGDSSDGKLEFAIKYCTITELNQITAVDQINTYEQLNQHLQELIRLYETDDSLIQNSISHAYGKYDGLASVRTNATLFTNSSFRPSLSKQVSIPHRMLQKQMSADTNKRTLGATLLVSEQEVLSFRRFTTYHPEEETYDFDVENVIDIPRERLFDSEKMAGVH